MSRIRWHDRLKIVESVAHVQRVYVRRSVGSCVVIFDVINLGRTEHTHTHTILLVIAFKSTNHFRSKYSHWFRIRNAKTTYTLRCVFEKIRHRNVNALEGASVDGWFEICLMCRLSFSAISISFHIEMNVLMCSRGLMSRINANVVTLQVVRKYNWIYSFCTHELGRQTRIASWAIYVNDVYHCEPRLADWMMWKLRTGRMGKKETRMNLFGMLETLHEHVIGYQLCRCQFDLNSFWTVPLRYSDDAQQPKINFLRHFLIHLLL